MIRKRLFTLEPPFTNRHSHTRRRSPTHMLKKCFVGDMCTPYRKKITSNQDRVGCVQALLIWRGLEGVTCVYGIRNGRHSNPMLPCQGMFMGGSLPFLFYPSSNANRKSTCVLAQIFSWPWFTDEKAIRKLFAFHVQSRTYKLKKNYLLLTEGRNMLRYIIKCTTFFNNLTLL